MKVKKIGKEWWIVDAPVYTIDGEEFDSYGPYGTKAEAESDKKGMKAFFDENGTD